MISKSIEPEHPAVMELRVLFAAIGKPFSAIQAEQTCPNCGMEKTNQSQEPLQEA